MIAVPDEYPQLVAEDASATYSLDKPVTRRMTLDLVAVHKDSGQEQRLPLSWYEIINLTKFIEASKDAAARFIGQQTTSFVFHYDSRHGFAIRWRSQWLNVSSKAAYQLAEALKPYLPSTSFSSPQ